MNHLPWLQHLSHNIKDFDNSLFGLVNLTRTAVGTSGIYWAAMVIVVASALAQYFQSKMLMPQDPQARSLRRILADAGSGKQAEQSEVNAAVGKSSLYLMPMLILFVSLRLAVALPLYWLVGAIVAYFQQRSILGRDVSQADAAVKISQDSSLEAPIKNKKSRKRSSKKRRKR